jgi:hypothetical protein
MILGDAELFSDLALGRNPGERLGNLSNRSRKVAAIRVIQQGLNHLKICNELVSQPLPGGGGGLAVENLLYPLENAFLR